MPAATAQPPTVILRPPDRRQYRCHGSRFRGSPALPRRQRRDAGTDDRFERVGETYASYYGYDSEVLVGTHWSELHPSDEGKHIRTHVSPVVRSGRKWTGQSKGLRADETTVTESKMVTALEGGRIVVAVDEIDDSGLAEHK
ncbi:PAS fold-containing protein [Haloarcula vallismortis]|uniref:HTR-like protein n=2 Tax=Haloarcula vallismortis TaxID=28442 RepID=M0JQS3_HALVA|nr:PAS domain-containing protein [Haloarcula vallismortis]EMA11341.1 HTR-like protein [Haloarcula vallismortis ATCC 29715]SDW38476.1 PAS fold-containing protein [Haloarcula vallismortis]